MFNVSGIIPITINAAQIYFQFCIITTILKNRVHWAITLICSIVISSLYFQNPLMMLGVFYGSTIAYYCLIAKMRFKPAVLAVSMHLFLSQFVGNIWNIVYFAFSPTIGLNYTRSGTTLTFIALFIIVRRFKIDVSNLTRDKIIFILSSIMMLSPLLSLWNEYLYAFEAMSQIIQILNSFWVMAMQLAVIYISFMLNKFATEVEYSELQQKYTDTLKESLDNLQGFQHDFYNIVNTVRGYCRLKDYDGLERYINGLENIIDVDNNKIEINVSIKDNMPYIYGIVLSHTALAVTKGVRFDIDVPATEFELKTLSEMQLNRIVGNLLSNAIEHAALSTGKRVTMRISNYLKEKLRIVITNSVDEKVDVTKISRKGVSGKKGHSGFGLYEVKSIVNRQKNEGMYIEVSFYCTDSTFTADLLI